MATEPTTEARTLLRHIDQTLEDQFGGWWTDAPRTDVLGKLRDEIRAAYRSAAFQEMPGGDS